MSVFLAKSALLTSHLPNIEKQQQWQSEATHTQSTLCCTATMIRLMHTVASAAMRPGPVALWV